VRGVLSLLVRLSYLIEIIRHVWPINREERLE
jgi:hypothetical protein